MQKRTRKLIMLLAVLMLMTVCFAFGVSAERTILETGNCGADGDNVTYVLYDDGELVISGNGAMKNCVEYYENEDSSGALEIGQPYYGDKIKKVTILEGVTSIGNDLFFDYDTIEQVVLPESIEAIGINAFSGCDNLVEINLPCRSIHIGRKAFYNTGYYNNICNWDNNILYIGNHLIDVNESVSGDIEIKSGTLSIAEKAFSSCFKPINVNIPDTVEIIEDNAFQQCYGLNSIFVNDANAKYSSDKYGVLFNKEKTEVIKYPVSSSDENYEIPNTVKAIKPRSFEMSFNLVTVEIPDGVTDIGKYAFQGCMKLENIYLPDSLKTIDYMAFYGCISLKNFSIPKNVERVGRGAFADTVNEKIYVKGMNTVFSKQPIFESIMTITGISTQAFAEKYYFIMFPENADSSEQVKKELIQCMSYFDNYTYTGTIYCHSGSTAEVYAIENGENYILTHFYEDDWTYDYDNMIRTRKCINCDELEAEAIEDDDSVINTPTEPGESTKPTPDIPSSSTEKCDCNCHGNGFLSFIYSILNFFLRIFGGEPCCDC